MTGYSNRMQHYTYSTIIVIVRCTSFDMLIKQVNQPKQCQSSLAFPAFSVITTLSKYRLQSKGPKQSSVVHHIPFYIFYHFLCEPSEHHKLRFSLSLETLQFLIRFYILLELCVYGFLGHLVYVKTLLRYNPSKVIDTLSQPQKIYQNYSFHDQYQNNSETKQNFPDQQTKTETALQNYI